MKYLPLIWAALRRNPIELLFNLCAMTVAFTLLGSMVALNAAYDRAIAATRMDRLYVVCAFQCNGGLPIGYRDQLARISGVTAIGYQGFLDGYHQERANRIHVYMVDAGMQGGWSELSLSPGDWHTLQATPTGLFFSRKAATLWHIRKGDMFPIIVDPSKRADGATSWFFTVLGTFDNPQQSPGQSQEIVLGNYQYLNESLPVSDQNRGGMFRVAVDHEDHARPICQDIESHFANSSTAVFCVPVRDDAAGLINSTTNMQHMSLGVGAAGLFMILFLCGNGIAESVRERLFEFGVLKSFGFDDRRIAMLIFAEAALPAMLAALIGTALAWMAGKEISTLSVKAVGGIPNPAVSFGVLGYSVAAALLIALVCTLLPLRSIRTVDVAAVLSPK